MKKYLTCSLVYGSLALACGVFYREFTKAMSFTGVTTLGKAHPHYLILGVVFFLLLALFKDKLEFEKEKYYPAAFILYNVGLNVAVIMMIVRGVLQVLGTSLSSGINGMISGIAGLGHLALGTGLILILVALLRSAKKKEA